jgi:hypothetical protein
MPLVPALTYAEAKTMALVFDQAIYNIILQVPQDGQHRAKPVQLTSDSWMLCADLLTEIYPNGLYAVGFASLPQSYFNQVDVMPWAEATALLPETEPV